jgi:PmbA protein
MMEKILEKAMKRADGAEVYSEKSEERNIRFKANRLHSVNVKETSGVGLRVIHNKRLGFSSSMDLSQGDRLVEKTLESSEFGQDAKFSFPSIESDLKPAPTVKVYSDEVRDFSPEMGIEMGKEILDGIMSGNSEIKTEVYIEKEISEIRIKNSSGLDLNYDSTFFAIYIEGFLIVDGSFLWITEGKATSSLVQDTKPFVEELLWKADLARKVAPVKTKKMPVLFSPWTIPTLLEAFEMGVNGKRIMKGSSPLLNRKGEKIIDERITLWDDGTLDYGLGSSPFDGEGIPARKTVLFEKGVLKNYLFDLQTAGILGEESTGNGDRGFETQPSPGSSNFVVQPGEKSTEEMIKDIDEGLIVYDMIGGGQSNLLSGDFSVTIGLGFKVEKGEMVGRVKDVMVSGNVYELFNRIRNIGSEVKQVFGVYTPPISIDGVNVASGDD